jgi:hypothetical protein
MGHDRIQEDPSPDSVVPGHSPLDRSHILDERSQQHRADQSLHLVQSGLPLIDHSQRVMADRDTMDMEVDRLLRHPSQTQQDMFFPGAQNDLTPQIRATAGQMGQQTVIYPSVLVQSMGEQDQTEALRQ